MIILKKLSEREFTSLYPCIPDRISDWNIFHLLEKYFPNARYTIEIFKLCEDLVSSNEDKRFDFWMLWKEGNFKLSSFLKLCQNDDKFSIYQKRFEDEPDSDNLKNYI